MEGRFELDTFGTKPLALIQDRSLDFDVIAPWPERALFTKVPVGEFLSVFPVQHR